MNLTDLHDVLDERSAAYDVEARSHLILGGVHRRLAIRRRRRIVATAAAVVVVLAVGAASLAVDRPTRRTPAVAPTVAMVNGFPEYAAGARVIAASPPLAPGATTLRLSFTPRTTALVIFAKCDNDPKPYDVALNGRSTMSGTGCGTAFTLDPADKSSGVKAGRPSVLTATFPEGPVAGFAVAVGEQVPVDQYVFPPRPASLPPAENFSEPDAGDGTRVVVRADPADPNRPVSVPFTWGTGVHLLLRAQTPGAMRVSVDDLVVAQGQFWDYQDALIDGGYDSDWRRGALPARGARATITVVPERMSGNWSVVLQQAR